MARQLGRLGAQGTRALGAQGAGRAGRWARRALGAGRWSEIRARGALRHGRIACDTASWRPRYDSLCAHDTAMEACETRGAQRAGARPSHAAIWPLGPTTRTAPCHDTAGDPTTIRRPCARLGAPVRAWACLLGQLGARASGLFFF